MTGLLLRGKDGHPLSDRIWRILHYEGENFVLFIHGKPQKGKSRTALHIASTVDPSFTIRERVAVMDPEWFNDILNQPHKRGDALLWDDCGVGLDSRLWYKFINIALVHILQTMGHEGLLLILTTPHLSYIDTKGRKLICGLIKTIKYYPQHGYTIATFRSLEPKEYEDDFYKIRPRIKYGRKVKIIDSFKFPNPPREMLKEYYEMSTPEKTGLKKKYQNALRELREIKDGREKSNLDIAQEIIVDKDNYIKKWSNRTFIDADEIMGRKGVGKTRAYAIKKIVESELGLAQKPTVNI